MGESSRPDKRLLDCVIVRIEKSHSIDNFPKEIENYFSYVVSKWKKTGEDATKLVDTIRHERLFMITQERQITGERETVSVDAAPKIISTFFADMSTDTMEWIEGSVGSFVSHQNVENDSLEPEDDDDDSTIGKSEGSREDDNLDTQDDPGIYQSNHETDTNPSKPSQHTKGYLNLHKLQPHLPSLKSLKKNISRYSPSLPTFEKTTPSNHLLIDEKASDHQFFIGATFRFDSPTSLQLELKMVEISTKKSMKLTNTKRTEVESAEVNAKTVLFQLNMMVWNKNLDKLKKLPDAEYLS